MANCYWTNEANKYHQSEAQAHYDYEQARQHAEDSFETAEWENVLAYADEDDLQKAGNDAEALGLVLLAAKESYLDSIAELS